MPRIFKNIVFTAFLLVAVLILVNIFVIMPLLRLKPEQNSFAREERVIENVEAKETVVTIDTLAVIKQTGGDEGALSINSRDENVRNPFFWPGERLQHKAVTKTKTEVAPEKPAPPEPELSMVIIGEGRRQALLDNVFVREGEMFHGYLVKRIAENEVILSDKLGEISIFLASGKQTGNGSQASGGLIEQ